MNKKEMEEKLNQASQAINHEPTNTVETTRETLAKKFAKFVVAHPGLTVTQDGKTYLKAEAWQYLLAQVGLFPSCECITLYHTDEETREEIFKGVKVDVSLNNAQGVTIAHSMMVARTDEDWLRDKPDYAVYGTAQTRAISRAARNIYGWVAVQAGFEAVPWEEMRKAKQGNVVLPF